MKRASAVVTIVSVGIGPCAHAKLACLQRAAGQHFAVQILGHLHHLARTLREHASDVRRRHPVGRTQEKRRADLLLQSLDAARQRRLAQVQRHGSTGKAAVFGQRQHMTHLSKIDRHACRI